jgi:hypothetical protein
MRPTAGGVYETVAGAPLPLSIAKADVEIVLHAGTAREYSSSSSITLVREPYFEVDLKSGGWLRHYGDQIVVSARLREAGTRLSPETTFTSPTAIIRAELVAAPGGQRSASVWLDPRQAGSDEYVGYIPVQVRCAGTYSVTYAVGGTDSRSGKRLAYAETVSTDITPTWLDTLIEGGTLAARLAAAVLAMLVVVLVWGVIWAFRLPRMRGGTLTITRPSAPTPKGKGARTSAKTTQGVPGGGLEGLMAAAAASSQAAGQVASTKSAEGPDAGRPHDFKLQGHKLLPCRPGRLFFVHGVRSGRGPRALSARTPDMSKQVFIVWYVEFLIPRKQRCLSGDSLTIGRHTLTFR